ncbi:RIP metalloprotease, partial [bacterium]|nr:RIP metalloprotease [bacterium]
MTTIWSTVLSILEFILAFGALVFLHELGHFIAARSNKIEVEEFGFGYPPKILRLFRAGGTDFTINWIPFGGFCRMKGEAGDTMEVGSFAAANPWRRLATLLGGPITNLMIGMLLIAFLFTRVGAPDLTKVKIIDIAPNSPASAELLVGDMITQLNGQPVDSIEKLTQLVRPNLGSEVTLTILRDGTPLDIKITPRKNSPEGEGAMGVAISNPVNKITYLQAIPMAFVSTLDQGYQMLMIPVRLISGQIAASDARMVSVKGIYDIFSQVQTIDKEATAVDPSVKGLTVLNFLAMISIALGFTNLLPIPALDGGHILFLIPEILFKKRVKPELEGRVHFIGYVILMGLMVVMVINDIIN